MVALLAVPAPAGAGTTEEQRTIRIRAVEPRDDVFYVKGRVLPDYPGRRAVVQRRLRSAEKWSRWRRFRTSDESRYRQRVKALERPGAVCYRVRVRASNGYAESHSGKICIRTFWK